MRNLQSVHKLHSLFAHDAPMPGVGDWTPPTSPGDVRQQRKIKKGTFF
jgi:hypothetical protein